MITESLLLASFLILMAVAVEAKVKSKTGFFIVSVCVIVGIMDLILAVFQLMF